MFLHSALKFSDESETSVPNANESTTGYVGNLDTYCEMRVPGRLMAADHGKNIILSFLISLFHSPLFFFIIIPFKIPVIKGTISIRQSCLGGFNATGLLSVGLFWVEFVSGCFSKQNCAGKLITCPLLPPFLTSKLYACQLHLIGLLFTCSDCLFDHFLS